jgi:hypothetical protein
LVPDDVLASLTNRSGDLLAVNPKVAAAHRAREPLRAGAFAGSVLGVDDGIVSGVSSAR